MNIAVIDDEKVVRRTHYQFFMKNSSNSTYRSRIAKVDVMFQKCINTEKDRVFFGEAMLNAKWVREHASYSSEDYVLFV